MSSQVATTTWQFLEPTSSKSRGLSTLPSQLTRSDIPCQRYLGDLLDAETEPAKGLCEPCTTPVLGFLAVVRLLQVRRLLYTERELLPLQLGQGIRLIQTVSGSSKQNMCTGKQLVND